MINNIDEAIKHCEEEAEEQQRMGERNYDDDCLEYAKEYRQLAEWLKELKERREIQDILLQFIVDIDLDVCCEDLINNEEEQRICEENCSNYSKDCWIRWAKMKIRESDNNDT